MKKQFVVYQHRRKDTGEIFYIGIGDIKRPYKKTNRTKWWKSVVKKHGYSVEILYTTNTWDQAAVIEIMLIEKYGRINIEPNGILVNRTKGGQGAVGRPCSEETRKKIGKTHLGNTYNLGRKFNDEVKKKMSECKIGVYVGKNNPMYGTSRTGEENPFYGKEHTEETKKLISDTRIKKGLSKGENNTQAKITKEDVLYIRKHGILGVNQSKKGNLNEIAKKLGVNKDLVYNAFRGRTWKHI